MGDHTDAAHAGDGADGTVDEAFVVIVADPMTGEVDAFGPFDEVVARSEVARRRRELDSEDLDDVVVTAVVLTPPV